MEDIRAQLGLIEAVSHWDLGPGPHWHPGAGPHWDLGPQMGIHLGAVSLSCSKLIALALHFSQKNSKGTHAAESTGQNLCPSDMYLFQIHT